MKRLKSKLAYSVVIPVHNEKGNVAKLFAEVAREMQRRKKAYEIIFVDDASTDGTWDELLKLHPATLIRFRKNFGQSSALDAGIKQSQGDIIITMDGDGQDNPKHIPELLKELGHGFDVVCAWRHKRNDPWSKRFVSSGAAFLRRFFVDDGVHDAGTQFRVYRREVFDDLDLYGEMHRMIPALMKWRGFSVSEVKVSHRKRQYGVSKYSTGRILKGFLDMLYIWFWRKYSTRPLHFFGGLGMVSFGIGAAILLVMVYMRLFSQYFLSDKIWPLVGFFFILAGMQLMITGLLAANMVESFHGKKYYVREVVENNKGRRS